jgi:hypothetical protein
VPNGYGNDVRPLLFDKSTLLNNMVAVLKVTFHPGKFIRFVEKVPTPMEEGI